MEQLKDIKFRVKSFFHSDDSSPMRLSELLSKEIWRFIERNEKFQDFIVNCLNSIEKQIAKTGQHVSDACVTINLFDRNCDVDQMVCKDISVVFHSAEGTYKSYEFEDEVYLSDFNLPVDLAKSGVLLMDLIKKEYSKNTDWVVDLCFLFFCLSCLALALTFILKI